MNDQQETIIGILIRQFEGHDILSMDIQPELIQIDTYSNKWIRRLDTGRKEISLVLQKRPETQKTQDPDDQDWAF